MSAIFTVVESTIVRVPDTVKLPLTITSSSRVIVPPAESNVRLPLEVSISLSPVTPTLIFPNVPPATSIEDADTAFVTSKSPPLSNFTPVLPLPNSSNTSLLEPGCNFKLSLVFFIT